VLPLPPTATTVATDAIRMLGQAKVKFFNVTRLTLARFRPMQKSEKLTVDPWPSITKSAAPATCQCTYLGW
jgi:hypothetical protein